MNQMIKPKKKRKTILSYMKRHWAMYIFAIVMLAAVIGLKAVMPRVTERIINEGLAPGISSMDERMDIVLPLLLTVLLMGIIRAVANFFKEYTADKIGVYIGRDMRRDMFAHVTGLSMNYHNKTNTGELMARLKDDVDRVWFVLGFAGVLTVECIVHTITTLVCMFNYSPLLTLVPIVFMIIVGIVALGMEKGLDKAFSDLSEVNAELTTVAQENLAGVRTVKAFSREGHEIIKFRQKNRKYFETSQVLAKVFRKYYPYINVIGSLLTVLVTVLGAVLVLSEKGYLSLGFLEPIAGNMDEGKLIAFVSYATEIIWPMECLGWLANEIASALASAKKLNAILGEKSDITDPEDPVTLAEVKGDLEFRNVSFEPEGKTVLKNVSFSVPQGSTLGIMGMTGSGKSSIINLAERFYDVTDGEITLDGVDIRKLELKTVRGSMAAVMQDVFLFSDTIAENIKLGTDGKLSQEDMEKAAKDAGAAEFIDKLSERYETVVGERGVGLSGGQKQRISIARALSKKPKILILDDATSALDMETEYEIQQSLDKLSGCSKIIVAHRISAVKDADEIIVLDGGSIAERGTHSELMKKRGMYFNTYVAQYNTEEDMVERSEV